MGYLTNTSLQNKRRCQYASMVSGFDVEFKDHPIPKDPYDFEFPYYDDAALYGVYGSVYSNEPRDKDHGPFWRAWDEYKT